MSTVSVVIRALNEAEHLPALLEGIAAGTRRPEQVVLVDSGSSDDTVAIAEAHGAKIACIAPEQFSFGRALNLGCSHATGEVLVFVSAHVYPLDEHWLERLVQPFDEGVALSYGRQTGDHRTQFSESQVLRRWFPEDSDDDQRNPFCNNANCAVLRSAWERLRYDETLTGLEDLDWATRAQAAGHRLAYQADAVVVHVHEERFRQTLNRYRREAIAHQRIGSGVYLGVLEAAWLFFGNVARDYIAAVASRCFTTNLLGIPRFRLAQFWGSWTGSRQRGEVDADLKRRFYYPRGLPSRSTWDGTDTSVVDRR